MREIPLTGHVLGWQPLDKLGKLVEEAHRYVDKGYKALKMRGGRGLPSRGDIESARALRKEFGDKIDLLVDVNSEYGSYTAAPFAKPAREAGWNGVARIARTALDFSFTGKSRGSNSSGTQLASHGCGCAKVCKVHSFARLVYRT